MVERLQSKTANRSTFDLMFPPAELALLAEDGIVMGFGVGEMVPVPHGEDEEPLPPVFRRLDPEFLIWDWSSMRWYYRTVQGDVEVTPGDGRWVLHIPGGTQAPWNNGLIRALGRSYIVKEHAISLRQNYATKLANPARVAHAAAGAAEDHRRGFLQRLIAWGINTVFELPIGWDVKLLESNGRGYEVWQDEENSSNKDMTVALAGQEVTTTGGTGFANASIHQAIRADLIKGDAMALAWTINTQVIPQWVESSFDSDEQFHAVVEWDAEPAKDRVQDTQVMVQTASAITQLNRALAPYGSQVDAAELCQRYGIPIRGDIDGDGRPEVKPKLVLVDENYSEENVAA